MDVSHVQGSQTNSHETGDASHPSDDQSRQDNLFDEVKR
jgi:hypothetical protein